MKKLLVAIIFLLCFSGCQEETENIFSLDVETKNAYLTKINDILKKEHWNYNEDSIAFEESSIPDESVNGFDEVQKVSETDGYDIDSCKGKDAVCASVALLHFNNDEAGKAYFYFQDSDLDCAYYVSSDDNIYSFSEINVFSNNIFSGKTENNDIKAHFKEITVDKPFDGFNDSFSSVFGIISDNKVKFFKFQNNTFNFEKELDFSGENLFPMDLSFDDNGNIAVLLGKKKKSEHEIIQTQNEPLDFSPDESIVDEIDIFISDRIIFIDSDYQNQFKPCLLDVSSYTSIDYNNGKIFASRGKGIDVFSNQNGVFSKTKQYLLKQWVEKIKSSDIDGDGINEFVMTDGTNLFLYRLDDVAVFLWRTHLSLKSIDKKFYVEDLNGDGIKEIFISDISLKTSTRYTLADFGFKPFSAAYGETYIPGDFDGDGKTDYMVIYGDTSDCKIFLAD